LNNNKKTFYALKNPGHDHKGKKEFIGFAAGTQTTTYFVFKKDRATRNPNLQELQNPSAALKGKKICEASHRATFLTIFFAGIDGAPWRGGV